MSATLFGAQYGGRCASVISCQILHCKGLGQLDPVITTRFFYHEIFMEETQKSGPTENAGIPTVKYKNSQIIPKFMYFKIQILFYNYCKIQIYVFLN